MTNPLSKALLLFSGGLDSTTALYWALREGYLVTALSISYYYRSPREIGAIREIASSTGIPLIEIDLPFLKDFGDLKYEQFPLTYVQNAPEGYLPAKNLIFTSLGAYYCEVLGINTLIIGHVRQDETHYRDASPQFYHQFTDLVHIMSIPHPDHHFSIITPFITMTKAEVVQLATQLHVPIEKTWSCYQWQNHPCGSCKACRERKAAFLQARIDDPLQ